jgi:hypothetical protein
MWTTAGMAAFATSTIEVVRSADKAKLPAGGKEIAATRKVAITHSLSDLREKRSGITNLLETAFISG